MKTNSFSVPELSTTQMTIAKNLGFTTTGTIETMISMAKGNPAIHWLVAKWFVDLLNKGEWGSAWSEVFQDILQHHGCNRPESNGTTELASLFLNYMVDDQDELMAELLSGVSDVLSKVIDLQDVSIQSKQETQSLAL